MLNAYYILSSVWDAGDTEVSATAPAIGVHSLFMENEKMNKLIITFSILLCISMGNIFSLIALNILKLVSK